MSLVFHRISTGSFRTVSLVLALFARRTYLDMQFPCQMDIVRLQSWCGRICGSKLGMILIDLVGSPLSWAKWDRRVARDQGFGNDLGAANNVLGAFYKAYDRPRGRAENRIS